MNVVQITPGAGGMYCGGCFHDNALVTALRQLGHDTLMIPLYLPLTLDEPDQSANTPVFFGGISVYLEQRWPGFRRMPRWLRHLLAARPLLRWAAGRAAKTRAQEVGELTLSMLRGEQGNQACEIDDLVAWVGTHFSPDLLCLSNALLLGMARRLKTELRVPLVCLLQGEDSFLDGLPAPQRQTAWATLTDRAAAVDGFIAPSHYYARRMAARLQLPKEKMHVVPDGINLEDYQQFNARAHPDGSPAAPPVIGYFSRMCPEKGLDTLVAAYLLLRQRAGWERVRLHVGGGCGPGDESFVEKCRAQLAAAGAAEDTRFFPNVDRAEKLRLLHGFTVFSVPALYGEAFGLYVLEALAAGVPVVQPRHGGFPELVEATGGGLLYAPESPAALADALESLLHQPERARRLGEHGREHVAKNYTARAMARRVLDVFTAMREQAAESGAAT